jgi:flagellin
MTMGLRIQTNVAALNTHRQLTITDSLLTKSMERLSSGYRINRAKDDAAGLAIANNFRAEVRMLKISQQNASQGISLLQVAEGGAGKIEEMIERLFELANQAASTNTGNERSKLNTEADRIMSEIDRIAADTKYNGTQLLNQTSFLATFQIGTENSSDAQITVSIAQSLTTAGLGLSNLDLTSITSAQAAITTLNTALSSVNGFLGNIGAYQNRIEFAAANILIGIENKSASESVIRDVDMAWEMVNFTKNQILLQSGTAMLAQANLAPQSVLALLGQ